jgi:hypothetical protein
VGRIRREGHHPAATDDLVPRDLRQDQMIVDPREATARQVPRSARGTRRFEAIA